MRLNKKLRGKGNKGSLELLLLAVPGIIWLLVFSYLPMGGLIVAFKNYNPRMGILGSPWAGLDNFQYLFKSLDAFRIIRNTLLYNFSFIVIGTIAAVATALLLDTVRSKRFLKSMQTVYFLPYFISWVVIGFMAQILFGYDKGIFNQVITFFGGDPVAWYQEPSHWRWIMPMFHVWKTVGYNSVVYFGTIMGIDQTLFEAAEIDGCTSWQKIRYVTLPMLKSTVVILTILAIGNILRADFGMFYYVTNNQGALYATTDVVDTYLFRTLTVTGNISASSAVGFFQSVVGMILVITTNAVVKKIDDSSALF